MGLAHLEYTEKAVTGLKELINALSCKFLTSVLALAASVFFVIVERFLCEAYLEKLYAQICLAIRSDVSADSARATPS